MIVALAAGARSAGAAVPGEAPGPLTGFNPTPSVGLLSSGLIDLSRFEVSHRLSYGVSSSSFGGTRSGGLWTTRLGYRLSDPLTMSVDVGAAIDPMGDGPMFSEKNIFLKGFNLDYTPSRNFSIHVSYLNQPPNAASILGYDYPGTGLGYGPTGMFRGLDR
jgi:hypothetical protein